MFPLCELRWRYKSQYIVCGFTRMVCNLRQWIGFRASILAAKKDAKQFCTLHAGVTPFLRNEFFRGM